MEPSKINQTIDVNDITTLSHHPYILCHFANYALCLLCVRRVVEGSWVCSAGV